MKLNNVKSNQTEVTFHNDVVVFFSYKTPVAMWIPGNRPVLTNHKWSTTTSRHINEFLDRNGLSPRNACEFRDQDYFDNIIAKSDIELKEVA